MMDRDELEIHEGSMRDEIITKFCSYWKTSDELKKIITNPEISSEQLPNLINHFSGLQSHEFTNQQRLADILYEIVGQKFLRNRKFLKLIFSAIKQTDINSQYENLIIQEAENYSGKKLTSLDQVVALHRNDGWMIKLANLLGFSPTCGLREKQETVLHSETVKPHVNLNPLYDYQYSIGRQIRDMLDGRSPLKRGIVSLPTGAGKTRLITETLIDWINETEDFRTNSKFILWITQTEELCEQSFGSFKAVFEDKGKPDTTLELFRFFGKHNQLPELHESGIIISGINMLNGEHENNPSGLGEMASKTSVIIIDEAHHSTADMYVHVLTDMGFNFDRRKKSLPENKYGIVLLGLTATPFRGSGNIIKDEQIEGEIAETETQKLHRFYSHNFLLPTLSSNEIAGFNEKPHALMDSQTTASKNEWVRFNGNRSYDQDGKIVYYKWTIYDKDKNQVYSEGGDEKDSFHWKFQDEGVFSIELEVEDNEGSKNSDTRIITIFPEKSKLPENQSEQIKTIYKQLVQREILCDVYHRILRLDGRSSIEVSGEDLAYLDRYQDFNKKTIRSLGNDFNRNVRILQELVKLVQEGKHSILFFSCSVDHAKLISTVLNSCNIKSRYIYAETDRDERQDSIRKFKNGEIRVLCNFDILTTGFDAPKIDCIFIARPTMSYLLYTQMAGRGLRGIKNSGTKTCLLVDVDDYILKYNKERDTRERSELVWVHLKDFWLEENQEVVPKETEEYSSEQQYDPVKFLQDQTCECPRCKKVAKGFEQIVELFGISPKRRGKNNPYGVQSHCRACRSEERKITSSDELEEIPEIEQINDTKSYLELLKFIKSDMIMKANYQPVMLIHLINNGPSTKRNIAEALAKANNSKDVERFLNVPVYQVLADHGFVKKREDEDIYDLNVDLSLDGAKKILSELSNKLETIKPMPTPFEYVQQTIITHYQKLKEKLGYPPTSRLYSESNPPTSLEFINIQFRSYQEFQKEQGDILYKNHRLRETLADQYFELYDKFKRNLTETDIDNLGSFKISDYNECFGSFDTFRAIIDPIVSNLNIIEPVNEATLENDYRKVRKLLGHQPSFDELRLESDLGIEYYLRNFVSYEKYKKSMAIEEEILTDEELLRSDFYNLKKLFGIVPSYEQMCKYGKSPLLITKLYDDYSKFLQSIGEKEQPLTPQIIVKKKTELENQFDDWVRKLGKYNALLKLMNIYPVAYKVWFGKIEDFLEECEPNLLPLYDKMMAKKTKSTGNRFSEIIPKIMDKLKQTNRTNDNNSKSLIQHKNCLDCGNTFTRKIGNNRFICDKCGWESS